MVRPSSEKRHAPSDVSSPLYSAPFPRAIKAAFLFAVLIFLLSPSAFAQSGPIIVGDNTVGCTGANAGGVRYVTASNILQYCNGTAWTTLGSGGSSQWTTGADNDIYFNSGTTYSVGVGLTDPLWPLHVYKLNTTSADVAEYANYTKMEVSPSTNAGGNSSWKMDAVRGYAEVPAGNTRTFRKVTGVTGSAENYGTGGGANATIRGVLGTAYNNSAATLDWVTGVDGQAGILTGTVTELAGLKSVVDVDGGTVTNMYGAYIDPDIAAGTVTNRYGVYIDTYNGNATNDWGVYQASVLGRNYFAGNTGIGAANPSSELHLHTSSTTNYIELLLTNTATGTTAADGTLLGLDANALNAYLWNNENGYLYFGTNNAERMRIASNGNVGIGDTNPGATLTVNGSIATTPPSIINLTADNTLVTTAGRSYIRLTSNNTTATNRTFCLDAGTEGQILVLEWTSGTNKGELVDGGTSCASSVAANLSATWTPTAADATMQLIYRAATPQKWLELSRSAN